MTQAAGLRDVLAQSQRSGTPRRAVVLHADRLPPGLGKPHHLRLAREALASLAGADRAQAFDLPQGRLAIVWRGPGERELAHARVALGHLLAGQPEGTAPPVGELLTLYDLPAQAAWLLDEIAEEEMPAACGPPLQPLDAGQLARLETRLAQADLSRFARWRPVMRLGSKGGLAWEQRFFSLHDVAASLCPEHDLKADPWLFRRLTRTLDRRLLAMLAAPRELRGCGTFALNLNVETVLSADFVSFDEALPLALRGEVILMLDLADMLADPDGFAFARGFAQARGYRLALAGASLPALRFLDAAAAGLDYVHVACSAELMAAPGAAVTLAGAARIVLGNLDRAEAVDWAVRHGFGLGSGSAVNP